MSGILRAISKASKSRANRVLSETDVNRQIDIMLGREQRSATRAAAPVAQTPLEILKEQLLRDNAAKKLRVEQQARTAVEHNINAGVDARNTQIGLDNAAKRTKASNRATEAQQAGAKANNESFMSQLSKEVDANRARVKSESATAAALTKAQKGSKTATTSKTLGVILPTATVLMSSGIAALVSQSHLQATLQNGQLVDPNGKPISDKTVASASKENGVSFLQASDSVERQIAERLPYTDVQVAPNGSEITINGQTLDRAQIRKDNGVTILTREEAANQGVDNTSNSALVFVTGETVTKFAGGVDSKKIVTASLPKSISDITRSMLDLQASLDAEATQRAADLVSNDPVVQDIFSKYDTMSSADQVSVDDSLKLYRDKAKVRALTEMAKDPQYAAQLDEITLLNATKSRMMNVQATLNSMPEEIRTISLAFPDSIGHPTIQANYLNDKGMMNNVILPFESKGRVEDINGLVDKGQRDAAINLASRTSNGREDLTRSIASELIFSGDSAMLATQKQLSATTVSNLVSGLSAKQKEARVKSTYSKLFKSEAGFKLAELFLSQAGLPPELGSAIRDHGLSDAGIQAVIGLATKGEKLDSSNIAELTSIMTDIGSMDTRIRQLIQTQSITTSSGLTESDILPYIADFTNTLSANIRAVNVKATNQQNLAGFGEHLFGI